MRVVSTSPLPIADSRIDPPEQFIGVARCDLIDADALGCLLLDRIDGEVLARAPKLRIVASCAVGYDNIDVAACTAMGVAVANTPDVLTEATAELAWALILAAARRLLEGEALARSGAWPGWRLDQLLGVELTGKTLGIVGLGQIGQAVARKADAFGMRVISAGSRDDVDSLFATADVVSLHCPLTPATRGMVSAARLAAMKPTAILVNTARGALVEAGALAEALTAGRLFAAALDVYADEPEIDRRLLDCPRLVLAPHIGSATTETRTKMAQLCIDAVTDVLAGRRPQHLVNPEVVIRHG